MRIAFFMNRFPLATETFIVNSAVGLIDAGHDVHLYPLLGRIGASVTQSLVHERDLYARTFDPNLAADTAWCRWASAPSTFSRIARRDGIATALSGLDVLRHGRRAAGMRALYEVETFRDDGNYDVLHCQFGTLADPILRHRRAGALKGAVVVHFRGYDISSHVARHGARYYERVFREADAFIANSAFFRDRAVSIGCPANRISVVESPVNLDLFQPRAVSPAPHPPWRLLTVGRLVEKKGITYAIEAVAQLREQGHEINYRIIGEGVERAALSRRVEELGLEGAVTLLGEQPQERIAAELADAHFFTAPSVTGSNGSADAAVNVLKEAMLVGVPVVATRHGGIPELVVHGESGLLAPERDARALAECLRELIASPLLAQEVATRGRLATERRFAMPAIARELMNVYGGATEHYRAQRPHYQTLVPA